MKIEAATPPKKLSSSLVIAERLGKDEMNLVEHPFALLRRARKGEIINLQWDKVHRTTGKSFVATWRVSGDSELGLPGPTEERLFLVLMELSREQGWPQTVMFSRGDILRRLSLKKSQASYSGLHNNFLRLVGVRIDAKRSFWDAVKQNYKASLMFALLDRVEMVDEPAGERRGQLPLALSSFKWSDDMYASLVAGNIRSLDVDFALSLQLPLSARLFRYLDKHRCGDTQSARNKFEIGLKRMCDIHLGMALSPYASKLKERLRDAHEELKARGFLSEVVYEPMKSHPGEEKVVYYFANQSLLRIETEALKAALADNAQQAASVAAIFSAPPDATVPVATLHAQLVPSQISLMLAMDLSDENICGAACDAIFEALDAPAREAINAWAKAKMPEMLQINLSCEGARNNMTRHRRTRVLSEHSEQVKEYLLTAIKKELNSG